MPPRSSFRFREKKSVARPFIAIAVALSAGQVLQWTAPITSIQPQGESMAELVPGSLADGTPGFMLKDGVIAR